MEESTRYEPSSFAEAIAITADAELIANNRRRWRALLFAHSADSHGNCHSCTGVRWPCRSRAVAERAEWLHNTQRQRSPGASA